MKIGDRIRIVMYSNRNSIFMLAGTNNRIVLIDLISGCRWHKAIPVKDMFDITEAEMNVALHTYKYEKIT